MQITNNLLSVFSSDCILTDRYEIGKSLKKQFKINHAGNSYHSSFAYHCIL